MKRVFLSGILTLACTAGSEASALEVYFPGSTPPESLSCPNDTRPNSPRPQAPSAETESIPAKEELSDLLANGPTEIRPPLPKTSPPVHAWRHIGIWGDSHSAANFFSEALIESLGLDPRRTLPGFIPPFVGSPAVRLPIRRACKGDGWKLEHAYLNRKGGATWQRALTRLRSQKENAYLWLDFRSPLLEGTFHALDIRLAKDETGGNATALIRLSVNGAPARLIELHTDQPQSLNLASDSPIATLQIDLVAGNIGIDGFIPHYTTVVPEYLVDTFGIPGSTARGLQFMATPATDIEDPWPAYDLIIAEYGTNEGNNPRFDADNYREDLRKSLTTLRQAYPQAACVLIGPTDRGVLVPRAHRAKKKACTGKGKRQHCKILKPAPVDILRFARTHDMISLIQADLGREFQCHSWSWQEAMGGKGGIYRWFYQNPPLAQRDLTHLTAKGYRYSAQLFARMLRDLSPSNPLPGTASGPGNEAPAPVKP